MAKVLYFLAGAPGIPPTAAETAEIAVINAIMTPSNEVNVMCGGSRASITGINLSADQSDNSLNDAGSTVTGTGISASATDNSLNDSNNGFVNAGFKVGDVLTIAGFSGAGDPDNNTTGEAIVYSVVAGKMVLTGVTLVSDDAGEAVTVSTGGRFLQRGFAKDMIVLVRGFTTSANNTSAGTIESVTATKMIISGTAGAAIVTEVAGDTVTICSVETGILQGDAAIVADYLAGTVPEQYKSAGTAIYTVYDPANPPDAAALVETQAVISNTEAVNVKNSALTATDATEAVVAAHACYVKLPATKTVVEDADTTTVSSKGIGVAVANGVLGVATFTNATDCAVSDGASTTVEGSAATVAVAARALGATTLTATTKKVVTDQDASTITGTGTAQAVKIGVAARALSGVTFTNATDTAITNGVATTLDSKGINLAVGSRALGVATFTAGTDCAVSNGGTVAVVNSAGTATDNATAAVAGNAITNVALPATKTVVESTDTVSVDGVSVPLVVSSGALAATTLVASGSTSKVISSGVEILASGVITTKVTVTIVDGVITACVGG